MIEFLLFATSDPLPGAIHVSRKLSVFDEVSFVDALLHGFSVGEVVICESARGQEVTDDIATLLFKAQTSHYDLSLRALMAYKR